MMTIIDIRTNFIVRISYIRPFESGEIGYGKEFYVNRIKFGVRRSFLLVNVLL